MRWLLNLIYLGLITAVSPWLVYTSWRTGKYRHGFRAKFFGDVPARTGFRDCVWLHAVSVGEVNLLSGVIEELSRRRPEVEFVITTTTQTGYALAQKKYAAYSVHYCPLDFSWAVAKALSRLRPNLLVLAELELWPNLISAARRENIPVVVINGRLSENSFRGYHRVRPAIANVLRQLTTVAVQNQEYAERFVALGAPSTNVAVTGSIKFDNANTDRNNSQTTALQRLVGIEPGHVVFLVGSTQAPEELLALATFEQLSRQHANLKLIVVPRHPERFEEVHQLLSNSGCRYLRRSEVGEASPRHTQDTNNDDWQVMLVDTIGELGAWWGTADVAFVGGSMGDRGGQNMIEPAAYGAAVCFGANTKNFRDVVSMLLNKNAAHVVNDGNELTVFVQKCLTDVEFAKAMGERARTLVTKQRGATVRTVDILESQLPQSKPILKPHSQHPARVPHGQFGQRLR